jgi:hypothetical protein
VDNLYFDSSSLAFSIVMADQASTSHGAKNDIWDKICDRTLLDDWVKQGGVITLTGVDLELIGADNRSSSCLRHMSQLWRS